MNRRPLPSFGPMLVIRAAVHRTRYRCCLRLRASSLREIYTDTIGTPKIEGVVIKGLGHAFPMRTGAGSPCGRPGDFVVNVQVCAITEIARFWGLAGSY